MREYLNRIRFKNYFIFIVITTCVFAILYHSAIFGSCTNLFTDIGSDSINLSYPKLYLNSSISQGYILNNGLGQYMPGKWYTMLQPFNWVRLFIHDIVAANLIALYFEYLVTAIFAYLFFRKHTDKDIVAVFGSILWTYSGYMVLWGQHGFNMPLAYFTCAMYFLQCILNKEKKGIFVVVPLTFLAINSYYFFYMSGLFMALYIIGFCIIKKYSYKHSFKELLRLFFLGVASVGIGAVGLLPSLRTYLVSARTAVAEQKTYSLLNNTQYMFSVIGRLLSNDIFGVGNDYTGYYNYYESAMLACSALFIPCVVIMIRNKMYRRPTLVLLLISILALCTPATSYVFNLDARKPRWTFMLILLMVLCVVYCVDAVLEGKLQVGKLEAFIVGVIYVILFSVLMVGDRSGVADVKRTPFIVAVIFTICYVVLINFISRKYSIILLGVLLVIEVIVNNYSSVNNRVCITNQMLADGLYNDGTEEILEFISDDDVYRVNKTYDSVFFNDEMVQGYNGLAVYNPTNSQWLIDYYQSLGYELLYGKIHFVRIGADRSIYNTLLGVKYIVAREGEAVPDNYKLIYSLEDKALYYNEQSLGFGYVYSNKMNKAQFEELSVDEREKCLTKYYYVTNDEKQDTQNLIDTNNIDANHALDILRDNSAYDVSLDGDMLTLSIDKTYEGEAMLCIPIIYDTNWLAYIDGVKVEITNINGGLVGVNLTDNNSGKHEIKLYYDAKEYRYGIIISIVSLAFFLIVCRFLFRRNGDVG